MTSWEDFGCLLGRLSDDFRVQVRGNAVRRRNARSPLRTLSYSSGGERSFDLARLWAAGARRIVHASRIPPRPAEIKRLALQSQ